MRGDMWVGSVRLPRPTSAERLAAMRAPVASWVAAATERIRAIRAAGLHIEAGDVERDVAAAIRMARDHELRRMLAERMLDSVDADRLSPYQRDELARAAGRSR